MQRRAAKSTDTDTARWLEGSQVRVFEFNVNIAEGKAVGLE